MEAKVILFKSGLPSLEYINQLDFRPNYLCLKIYEFKNRHMSEAEAGLYQKQLEEVLKNYKITINSGLQDQSFQLWYMCYRHRKYIRVAIHIYKTSDH